MGLSTSRFPASWAHNAEPIARVARTIAFLMPHLRPEESKRRAAKRHTWNRLGGGPRVSEGIQETYPARYPAAG